ncbi:MULTISPECIES: stage II sporulation protein M [Paenibacillus]|uniref:stage II sporulation protein M n=1 Tax=Paenibacillus TaxID=44249 RepID=UPI0020402A5E|nr:stage II sporulation protein M [Paenibacillus camelliae]MCM3635635.1 stage II sporulation protein M [Paenibacillus camelliae]
MFKLRNVWHDLKVTKQFIIVATIIFAVSIYVGMTNEGFTVFLNNQMNAMGQLVEQIDQSGNPTMSMMIFIFFNNAIKSVMVIFLGAFFGIFPVFFLAINGMLIGYILKLSIDGQMAISLFDLVVKTLLPHGILEIPALIIVAAYGLRLGRLLFSTMWALISNHNKLESIGASYKDTLKRCGVIALYATVVLLIASIIESTFTMWLASTIN